MKLLELRLHNFRQFAGEQTLQMAGDTQRNVTLLFGANGSGKTTLLNAFTWVLYGSLSDDLEVHRDLVTTHVWNDTKFGDSVAVAVELHFEHAGESFRVRREINTTKASQDQQLPPPQLRLWVVREDGRSDEVHAPQQRLDGVLPEQLSRFFFFNGERIENLVSKSAYSEVKQAIKTLLGLEQVERALTHLPKVEKKLNAELRKHGGDRAADIATRIDQGRERSDALKADLEGLELENSRLADESSEVITLLSQHQASAPLQAQRSSVVDELQRGKARLESLLVARRRKVAERGFLVFTSELEAKAAEMAEALSQRGELPAPIKRDFVDSLLDQEVCICGTPLKDDSPAHQMVKDWRSRAGLAEVEAAWQRLRGDLSRLPDARAELKDLMETTSAEVVQLQQRIRDLHDQQTGLDHEIAKLPLEDVQRLELKRGELERSMTTNNRQIGVLRERREAVVLEVEKLLRDLKNAEIKDELAIKARQRIELVQEVHSALTRILEIRTDTVRTELNNRIQQVFARITIKPFVPQLTSDFELGLFQMVNGEMRPVAKSTGENQILSLSFVAAVSELAREYRERSGGALLDAGGSFPLVMDAAFGSLDENYQRDVSRALPGMAPQMVVLVSKSQGLGTVFDELSKHTGELGVIVAHTSNQERDSESIALQGHEYPYVITSEGTDWAEVTGVRA